MKLKKLSVINKISHWLRIAYGVNRSWLLFGLFLLQVVGWVAVLYILTPFLASLSVPIWGKQIQLSVSDFILLITAAFILAYTYEAKKLREETVYQRKMAVASDIRFSMADYYEHKDADKDAVFGRFTAPEGLSSVVGVAFLNVIISEPIGRCGKFFKKDKEDEYPTARYDIISKEERHDFVQTLQIQDGTINARVVTTNGLQFTYTFAAVGDGWRNAHIAGKGYVKDEFILVKKELYQS